jgi:phage repressor protein C with HTH and peptisase S24 domain
MSNWYDRLREIREKHKLSQSELGRIIEKDGTQISRYERGAVKKFPNSLYRLLGKVFSEEEIDYIENGSSMVQEPAAPYGGGEPGRSVNVPVLSIKASAGGGNNVESVDVFESGEVLSVDRSLFKTAPSKRLHAIRVDGYSMIPMLYPDSWVIFEDAQEWSGDGLYIINWRNVLMVKLLQADIEAGKLWIKSVNPDYDSWHVDMENQENFRIFGKVVRCVI